MNWLYIFLGFSLLIVLHEGGHFFAAKATGMRVERFFLFFGPTIWSFKRGETEYGVKAIPLGGYVKISGMNPEEEVPPEHEHRAYYRQPVWKRIVVVAAGPAVNIALAFAILFFVYFVNAQQVEQKVGEIRGGTPAAKVLRPGDRIVAVDGKAYPGLDREARLKRFGEQVASHECAGKQVDGCLAATPVRLTIARDGAVQTISVRPEYDKANGRALIGFSYGSEAVAISPGTAATRALDSIWLVTHKTASIFSRIFEEEQRKQISGIVGVSDVANQTIDVGVYPSLLLLALVSLSLGLINLLPILPLDGGHIFWALVEKLRGGRPVSLRVMERATMIGFALVMVLMVIGLTNDIGRLGSDAYNVR
ncbi:MAG TPA: site-2 protease family protein [Solirubrobacterales bacterium]|jgi:regulator of sigma E protease|nr:site-2 protease family protein [Solirubrobacterales bacterium]